MRTASATYDSENNILYIDAHRAEFYPAYLKYVLQYLHIPANATLIFLKDCPKELTNGSDFNP